MADESTLLDFPCDFSVKAMGLATDEFEELVVDMVRRHAGDVAQGAVSSRPSKNGKYLAITVRIRATGKPQLDAIYAELSAHPKVLMAL